MPAVSDAEAEQRLVQAFRALEAHVAACVIAAAAGPAAIAVLGKTPEFSYLLTPKQFDEINRICMREAWPPITCRGILITASTLTHPIDSRGRKDNCTAAEACMIVTKAYSPRSLIRANRRHGQQTILLNTHQKIMLANGTFYAMAILAIVNEGSRCYLVPVTAYHANEAKARSIQRTSY